MKCFMIVLCLVLAMPVYAQTDDWTVINAEPLMVPDETNLLRLLPAPDGHHMAYFIDDDIRTVCSLDMLSGEKLCLDVPADFPDALFPTSYFQQVLTWSPDSTRLAVVGQPLANLIDTDLWIVDLAAKTVTNLADDEYQRELLPGKMAPGAVVDVQPAWSPDGTQIAVEHTTVNEEGGFNSSMISIIDMATGEVRDLTTLPGSQPGWVDIGSVISMDWSPDAATLAISVRHNEVDAANDGLWLVNVADGQMEQLLSLAEAEMSFHTVYPDAEFGDFLQSLDWSADGSRLLLWMPEYIGLPWSFWIDLATREVTAVPLPDVPTNQENEPGIWPMQAAWSPDGSALLVAAPQEVESGDQVMLLDSNSDLAEIGIWLIDPATLEYVLLGYLPFVPGDMSIDGVWGPDNDVIINGYHLELAG